MTGEPGGPMRLGCGHLFELHRVGRPGDFASEVMGMLVTSPELAIQQERFAGRIASNLLAA